MSTVKDIKAIEVLNSRGDWTIKTYLELSGGSIGYAIVPEGASKGEREAVCMDSKIAISTIAEKILPKLRNQKFESQKAFDKFLIDLDGTENKKNLGGNTVLSLSMAFSRAVAQAREQELYEYLQSESDNVGTRANITPLFNVLNGGKHAHNGLSFQEFMIIPAKGMSIHESLEVGRTVYKSLKEKLEKDGFSTGVGDEGGFAPQGFTVRKALGYIRDCASEHYRVGEKVFLGMDVAVDSFYADGKYKISEESRDLSPDEFKTCLIDLLSEFEIIYLEDMFHENDKKHWAQITRDFGNKSMISADDLVVTNPRILNDAIKLKLANTVIVKPNQVGTVWETLEFVSEARRAGWNIVVSHRSGDTEDSYISDLACAIGADFVKFGAVDRGERTSKFNRLIEISAR